MRDPLKMTETQLVAGCISHLNIAGHYVWRNNTGVFLHDYKTKLGIQKTSHIKASFKGASDIIGIHKDGRFLAVECKVGKNKPTPQQDEFIRRVQELGGYAYVVYSIEDLAKFKLIKL